MILNKNGCWTPVCSEGDQKLTKAKSRMDIKSTPKQVKFSIRTNIHLILYLLLNVKYGLENIS